MPKRVVALDTETIPFAPGDMTPTPVLATTASRLGGAKLWHGSAAMRSLCEHLDRTDCIVVGVNIAYDWRVLARHVCGMELVLRLYETGRVIDLGIYQRHLAIGGLAPFGGIATPGLTRLGQLHGVETAEKDEAIRLTFEDYQYPTPLPAAHRDYALSDATAPLEIFRRQLAAADGRVSLDAVAAWSYAHFAASLMTADGLQVDPERTAELEAIAREESSRMVQLAWNSNLVIAGRNVRRVFKRDIDRQPSLPGLQSPAEELVQVVLDDPAHPDLTIARKRVQWLVAAAYDGRPPMTERPKKAGPNWKPSVRVDAECLAESGDPQLEALAHLLEARKALTADVPLLNKRWLHPRIDFANTGRLQASKPNLMNMGKSGLKHRDGRVAPTVRECLAVPPDMCWLVADYPSLEFVTLAAHLAREGLPTTAKRLMDGCDSGRPYDPHLHLAAVSLGMTYEQALARKAEPEVKAARQRHKPATYGFPVGMAPATFVKFCAAMGVAVSEQEAAAIRDVWAAANPDMVELQRRHKLSVAPDGTYAMTPLGTGHTIRGGTFCGTLNSTFQGPGAAIAHECLRRFARACWARDERYPHLSTAKLKLFTHDEAVLHAPLAGRAAAARDVEQLMADAAVHVLGGLGRVLRPQCVALDLYSKDEAGHAVPAES